MARKTWIFIKRGLSEDPKHRDKMGMAVWVFMHMIDHADFETGMVYDWKDEEIAAEMTMPVRTIREWRQRLEEQGYVTTTRKQYGLDITILKWINPRSYAGKVLNTPIYGKAPSEQID